MNTLTHKHKHKHMNEKQTFYLQMSRAFFSFYFWKDEVKKLDNQSDDEEDMQMHGVSLGQ